MTTGNVLVFCTPLLAALACSSTVTGGASPDAGTEASSLGGGGAGDGVAGGGAGGTAPECNPSAAAPTESPVIDDFEDGNENILQVSGRVGSWWGATDTTSGVFSPADFREPAAGNTVNYTKLFPQTADTSAYAMHVSMSGFSDWGALFGASFNSGCLYDASIYSGLAFKAKGSGTVRVRVQIAATVPTTLGGTCTASCADGYGIDVDLPDPGTWTTFTVPWNMLAQEGWGTPAAFTSGQLSTIQFGIRANQALDIWLDDVSFIR